MKTYPSISKDILRGVPVYVFGKTDGSNMRVEFTPKQGFHKWGRRTGLLDDSNPVLKLAPGLFTARYGDRDGPLATVLRRERWEQVTLFFEFYGDDSFAGTHNPEDPTLEARIFDVSVYKRGFVGPPEFVKLFGHLPVQELLHHGNFTAELEAQVRAGTLPGTPPEGVVCKAPSPRPGGLPVMFKVKQDAWLEHLKVKCGGDERLFNLLA